MKSISFSNTPLPVAKVCYIYYGSRNFGLGFVWVHLLYHRLTPAMLSLYGTSGNCPACHPVQPHPLRLTRLLLLSFPSDLLSSPKHYCMDTVATGRRLFHAIPETLQRVPSCPIVSTFSCRCTYSVSWRWSGRLLRAIGLCQARREEEWTSWGCASLIPLHEGEIVQFQSLIVMLESLFI